MDRSRITLRCFSEDLGLALPGVDSELAADHPIADELVTRAPTAPAGLKRILAIGASLVYRLQRGRHRGAAWPDEKGDVPWLLATGLRRQGSSEDAYAHFARLHEAGRLLPTPDDAARIRLEAAARRYRRLSAEIPAAVGEARESAGHCISAAFDGVIPCRMLLVTGQACDELWVAVATVDLSGAGVEPRTRDVVFAMVESAAGPGEWEAVSEWPDGDLSWFEVARYGLLEA
ncbi:MAG TPA: hypothetical protein VFH61_08885 [Thermoleophilia bacterium]|nr:hypothetical protein [Thermoleophilia bacterium]